MLKTEERTGGVRVMSARHAADVRNMLHLVTGPEGTAPKAQTMGYSVGEPSNGKYFGGDVAAPVFPETVQQSLRLLGVQPDMSVKPQIVVQAVEESF